MAASANASYVLRLVLQRTAPQRRFSTAVLSQTRTEQPTRRAAVASSSLLASAPVERDFLEPESEDYSGAAEFLPDRQLKEPSPIPWPRLFRHDEPQPPQKHAKACDLVARLVAEGRLEPARKVYEELRALHTPIQHRAIYLSAAMSSLKPTPQGRADFLFWLELVPNRPATHNNPTLRERWDPIIQRLLAEHFTDQRFVADFLILAGRKGLCPTVLPLITAPLAAMMKPEVSERIFEATLDAYVGSVTSATSLSDRAAKVAELVTSQRGYYWNLYLRSLALAGWDDSARALLFSPPEGVTWSRHTRNIVLGQGLTIREAKGKARASTSAAAGGHTDPLQAVMQSPVSSPLSRDLRRALNSSNLPTVTDLADLQGRLIHIGRKELFDHFRRRFCYPPSTPRGRKAPTVQEMWWHHATIKRLADAGDHIEAVKVFRERFLWIGLPPASAAEDTNPDYSYLRRIPDIRVITTVLPSILACLPANEARAYHQSYLKQTLPPALEPTEYTHLAFVRQLGHLQGQEAATTAIQSIAVSGRDPGQPAWNALLLKLTGTGSVDAALAVLQGMETQAPFARNLRMPPPTGRTYAGLIRLCMQHGREDQASVLLDKFKTWSIARATEDDKLQLKSVEGDLTAYQHGRARQTPAEIQKQAVG